MNQYIGLDIEVVKKDLDIKGIKYNIINNNHNVEGDITLVTNFKLTEDNTAEITVGEFIFDLRK